MRVWETRVSVAICGWGGRHLEREAVDGGILDDQRMKRIDVGVQAHFVFG